MPKAELEGKILRLDPSIALGAPPKFECAALVLPKRVHWAEAGSTNGCLWEAASFVLLSALGVSSTMCVLGPVDWQGCN